MKIIDMEDGQIYFEGTKEDAKEWWWNHIHQSSDVGGYRLMTDEDYKKQYEDTQLPEQIVGQGLYGRGIC